MYRIVFSPDDLRRTRVTGSLGPGVESAFALDTWARGGWDYLRRWFQEVQTQLASEPSLRDRINRFLRSQPTRRALLPGSSPMGRTDERRSLRPSVPSEAEWVVREFHRIAVMPHWEEIQEQLDVARESYRFLMSSRGIDTLLGAAFGRTRWDGSALEVPSDTSRELRLDGRGLALSPSLFLRGAGEVLMPRGDGNSVSAVLVFPVRPDPRFTPELTSRPDLPGRPQAALAALMGKTRAAALQALADGCGNNELADRLGVSTSAASQHTAVLRAAGLISTRRGSGGVLHTMTPMGRSLLAGKPNVRGANQGGPTGR
ncbi:winged helix-turn-helix domain-containing protein [Streptomyces sp. NPDC088196]|uniref:ArsR/SmtB family transcription factor n=1 Tax=Streptomyces sp. NPDC088196 TaxID=3154868 RepID=UPI00344F3D1C